MGTGLVPIHLLTIIVQSNVVDEGTLNAVRAPVSFYRSSPGVDPDRRAASGHHDLGAQVALASVNQIPDVIRTFHPIAGCLLPGLFVFRSDAFWIRVGDAVRNVLAHPAKLLFTGLALSYCTRFFLFVVNTISSDCGKLVACRLLLVACSLKLAKLFTPGKSVRDRGTNSLTPDPWT